VSEALVRCSNCQAVVTIPEFTTSAPCEQCGTMARLRIPKGLIPPASATPAPHPYQIELVTLRVMGTVLAVLVACSIVFGLIYLGLRR
jgi:uncharacterized paraquat-inducible protein A